MITWEELTEKAEGAGVTGEMTIERIDVDRFMSTDELTIHINTDNSGSRSLCGCVSIYKS